MLNRFAAVYRLELRLLCWHWAYGLMLGLFSLWTISTANTTNALTNAKELLLFSLPAGIIAIISLGIMVLAAISLSRSTRNRFHLLEWSLPGGSEISLGRWTAIVTAAAAFMIVPLIMALVAGSFSDFLSALPTFLTHTLLIFALTTAMVWLIHETIGIRRWVYPLLVILWLGAGFTSTFNMRTFPWAMLLGFSTYGFTGRSYSSLWGTLREGNQIQWVTLFYAGVVLLLISIALWLVVKRRFYRSSWIVIAIGALGLIVTLGGAAAYSSEIMSANAQRDARNQFAKNLDADYYTYFHLPADVPYAITSYDVALNLSDIEKPTFTVSLTIVNTSDQPLSEITLSLNRLLDIGSINVPFERDWDYIRLLPEQPFAPHETLNVDMTYNGKIWWYGSTEFVGSPPRVDNFVAADGINLDCSAAWYPIPGRIAVDRQLISIEQPLPDCILAQPAAFTLHLDYTGDLRFASNLPAEDNQTFTGDAVTWVYLMASPHLKTEIVDDITVYAAQADFDLAVSNARTYYTPTLDYLRQFFPDIRKVNLFVMQGGLSDNFFNGTPANEGRLTLAADPRNLAAFPRSPLNKHLLDEQAFIESVLAQGGTPLAENVAYFLWAYQQAKDDPAQMQMLLGKGIDQGDAGTTHHYGLPIEERYKIAFAMYEIYQQQGDDGLKTLLTKLYDNAATISRLPDDQIITWINANAH